MGQPCSGNTSIISVLIFNAQTKPSAASIHSSCPLLLECSFKSQVSAGREGEEPHWVLIPIAYNTHTSQLCRREHPIQVTFLVPRYHNT